MRSTNLFSLLALSVPVLATKPRVSVGELVDVRVPVGKDVQVSQESNASIIARQDIFGGFNLFARDCDPGRYLCPDGGCCKTTQNCVGDGCCDKPKVACGTDGCYDPAERVCCQSRGTTCRLGYDCNEVQGCCPKGLKPCGGSNEYCYDEKDEKCCEDNGKCDKDETCVKGGCCKALSKPCGKKCYNVVFDICCTDGDDAWSCPKGEKCCAKSKGCYNPDTETCCSAGACPDSGSCCDKECCKSTETCGINGYCTATPTSTTSTTSTSSSTSTTTAGGDSAGAGAPASGGAPNEGAFGRGNNNIILAAAPIAVALLL